MKKPFTTVTIVALALIALSHALRIMLAWKVSIAGAHVPMWVSILTLIVAAGLAVGTWHENI
jgi:high-affinity Fe2+/Pb2+ permease